MALAALRDLRRRQHERDSAAKERRAELRRESTERAAEATRPKRQEQERKSAARLRASADRKRQPVLHRVDGESRGGVFDRIWSRGEGMWVRTARPPGRGMSWLESKSNCTSVRDPKRWPEGRLSVRQAVLGGWLRETEGTSCDAHQPAGAVDAGEIGAAERRAGEVGVAGAEPEGAAERRGEPRRRSPRI